MPFHLLRKLDKPHSPLEENEILDLMDILRTFTSPFGMIGSIYRNILRWRGKSLSIAGRKVVIQSVLSSIPQYWMGLRNLTNAHVAKIVKLHANFLWNGLGDRCRNVPLKWATVSKFTGFPLLGYVETPNLQCFRNFYRRQRGICSISCLFQV